MNRAVPSSAGFTGQAGGGVSTTAISPLYQYFSAADDPERASALLKNLLASGPWALVDFDGEVRRWTRFTFSDIDLARAGAPLPGTPLALALAMSSANGYRRAEALAHPSLERHPQLYPLVLIRAVDPVRQVRELAISLVPKLIDGSGKEQFSPMLQVAFHLRDRAHAAPMIAMVLRAFVGFADQDLLDILADLNSRAGRWIGREIIADGRLTARQLTVIALGRFNDQLQDECAESLAAQAMQAGAPELLRPLLDARSSRVRATALTGLIKLGDAARLSEFLSDRSAAVRATAQWGRRRAGHDPAVDYRRLLNAAPALPKPLIAGLGETGTSGDVALITPFLKDPRAKIRAAALNALRHLGAEVDLAWLLRDSSPAVTRTAAAYLAERRMMPPVHELRDLTEARWPAHVRRSAAVLLREHGVWQRLWSDLTLLDDLDRKLAGHAVSDLDNLCRTQIASISAPMADSLRADLQALIRARSTSLSKGHSETLSWLVATARAGAVN